MATLLSPQMYSQQGIKLIKSLIISNVESVSVIPHLVSLVTVSAEKTLLSDYDSHSAGQIPRHFIELKNSLPPLKQFTICPVLNHVCVVHTLKFLYFYTAF
jgi:hypothetical protein